MFMNFSNFLLCAVNASVAIHHEQSTFITYDLAGRERNNVQQLSKLIELKIFSTTWPHKLTLTVIATHQQISTCPNLFLITLRTLNLDKFSFLFIMKSLLNVNLYSKCLHHFTCCLLGKSSDSWIMLSLKWEHSCPMFNYQQSFSTLKLKLGHNFSLFIRRFKIEIFECWSMAVLPSFSQFTKRFRVFLMLL